ncbi:MAG: ferritin-like domain-containing protein [Burkholderiaceae bacterium]
MANEGYHEPINELSDETRDMHRAIVSLMEELEAVDWYNQRVDACKDPELKAILAHNRDEEKEHAAMTLEWIRRKDPQLTRNCATTCSPTRRSRTSERAFCRQGRCDCCRAIRAGKGGA